MMKVKRRKEGLNRIWKKHVEQESMKVGLSHEDVLWPPLWFVGVNQIAAS